MLTTPPERWQIERDEDDPQVATATMRDDDATATVRTSVCEDPPGYTVAWEAKRGGRKVGSGTAWARGRAPATVGMAAAEKSLREAPEARVTEPVRDVLKSDTDTAPDEEEK